MTRDDVHSKFFARFSPSFRFIWAGNCKNKQQSSLRLAKCFEFSSYVETGKTLPPRTSFPSFHRSGDGDGQPCRGPYCARNSSTTDWTDSCCSSRRSPSVCVIITRSNFQESALLPIDSGWSPRLRVQPVLCAWEDSNEMFYRQIATGGCGDQRGAVAIHGGGDN